MVSLPWKKKGWLPDTVESLDDLKGEFCTRGKTPGRWQPVRRADLGSE